MKSGPGGSWEMYSSALYFGHPAVTWRLRADANVEVLLEGGEKKKKSQRNLPQKEERYHMAVRARYTVSNFVHTLLLKHTHTFTVPIPPRFVSCAGLSLPSVSSCCCCSFLLSWENRGFFSLVSVFYRKYVSASRCLVLVPSVIPVRPAGTPPLPTTIT